jgi:hypothetical protein
MSCLRHALPRICLCKQTDADLVRVSAVQIQKQYGFQKPRLTAMRRVRGQSLVCGIPLLGTLYRRVYRPLMGRVVNAVIGTVAPR